MEPIDMSLMEKLILKNLSCSTLESGSGSQGYTPIQGTLKNNNLPCNPNVTFVTNVTCQLNQAVTEHPKEWFSALEILEKDDGLSRLVQPRRIMAEAKL